MLVDHEKVFAKAAELLPEALNELGKLKMGIEKTSDLSQFEITDAKYNILRAVLTAAGRGCTFDTMQVKLWMDGSHLVIRIHGTAP